MKHEHHHKKRATGFALFVKQEYHKEVKNHSSGTKPPTIIKALAAKWNKKKGK